MTRITSLQTAKKTFEEASEFRSRPIDKAIKLGDTHHPYKARPSEARRLRRISERAAGIHCLVCRQMGHVAAECSLAGEGQAGICYKCGSMQHSLRQCNRKVKGLPYAKCFVCRNYGHITSQCPQKNKGDYLNEENCQICGESWHLKEQCKRFGEVKLGMTVGTIGNSLGADDDEFHNLARLDDNNKPRGEAKKKRVVNF